VAAVICFIPLIPDGPYGVGPLTVPAYFAGPAAAALPPGSTALVLPFPSEFYFEPQMWQVAGNYPYRFNIPSGYFLLAQTDQGNIVATSALLDYTRDSLSARVFVGLAQGKVPKETPALKAALRAQFRQWHITSIVVPIADTPHAAESVSFLTWLEGKPTATNVSGATVWYRI
jgi:hypothetical protein